MLSLVASKVLVLGVLFFITFCLGLIPVRLMTFIQRSNAATSADVESSGRRSRPKLSTYKRILSFLSCFAAGVFLATCFLDLLPGVRKRLTTVLFEMNITSGFPFAEFIMACGLFFILIIEQITLLFKETRTVDPEPDERKPLLGKANKTKDGSGCRSDDSDHEFLQSDHTVTGISDQPDTHSIEDVECTENSVLSTNRRRSNSNVSHHHHHHHHHHDDLQSHSPLRALLLVVALSLHSVFEGLAVGLQSNTGQVLGIFAALVLHKSILSFSIGMSLVQSRLSIKICVKSILFFSLTSPVGVAIGILITYFGASVTSDLADGILTGIASGTFLYMTFFEVLPAEFNCSHDRMLKLLMLLLGFSAVTGVLFLSDDVKAPFCKISGEH